MIDLEKMRDDYQTVIGWWRDVECWPEEDLAIVGDLCAAAMAGPDAGLKQCWANYLGEKAETFRREQASKRSREAWLATI